MWASTQRVPRAAGAHPPLISGVVVPAVVVASAVAVSVVVTGHVVGAAAHHGQHRAAAGAHEPDQQGDGEDEGCDVEPGGVVPGDRLLTDLRPAVVGHQAEGTEDQLDGVPAGDHGRVEDA